jgi:cyclophilin family peptidyl-prolyl cis-trans isomerase
VAIVAVAAIIALFVFSNGSSPSKIASSTTVAPTTTGQPTTTITGTPPTAPPAPPGATITGATPCPNLNGSSPRTLHFASAPPSCIDPGKHWSATFNTTEGNITVAFDTSKTAGTANNFIVLALYHYYDKTSFDRIDTSIDIIQGGSPTTQSIADPGPGYTIHDEPGSQFTMDTQSTLHGPYNTYNPGDLVMARTTERNSAAAQYFFVVGPKGNSLGQTGTYVTFAHVTAGLDVLQKVEGLYEACPSSDQSCLGGAPSRVVLVNSVTISSS